MTEPKIIHEDNDVLVIDKPSGLAVHGTGSNPANTVVEWFLQHVPGAQGVGEPRLNEEGEAIERSGIIHRLDQDTSGVMILAKNQPTFTWLKDQFLNRQVKKEYRALVYGHMKEEWGTIDRPIGRSAADWRRRSAERGAKGHMREAKTDWELIKQGEYQGEKFAELRLKPQTGRMHQLRVHLKAIDHPIVGDDLYAGKRLEQSNNLGLSRLALHASKLELCLKEVEEARVFASELPNELTVAGNQLA